MTHEIREFPSYDRICELTDEILAEYGNEYVYSDFNSSQGCVYVRNAFTEAREAGCLIGVLLHKLGIPLEELERGNCHSGTNRLIEFFGPQISGDCNQGKVHRFVVCAQHKQDNGVCWGKAIKVAHLYAKNAQLDYKVATVALPVPEPVG